MDYPVVDYISHSSLGKGLKGVVSLTLLNHSDNKSLYIIIEDAKLTSIFEILHQCDLIRRFIYSVKSHKKEM